MLDGLLFDVLLMSGGIEEPYLVYPPDDPQSLQRLLDAIESSTYDTLKKDCLVYFLLKWHQDGRERTFEEQRCIPPQFVALSDAYWHLDTGINVPVRHCQVLHTFFVQSGIESCGPSFGCPVEQRLCIKNYARHFHLAGLSSTHPEICANCETTARRTAGY